MFEIIYFCEWEWKFLLHIVETRTEWKVYGVQLNKVSLSLWFWKLDILH